MPADYVKVDPNSDQIRADVIAISHQLVKEYGYDAADLMAFATRLYLSIGLTLLDLSENDQERLERSAVVLALLDEIRNHIMGLGTPITDPKLVN
jgi:hypothetical protein